MEIGNSEDFDIFEVFWGCLELQRGQVIYRNSRLKNLERQVMGNVRKLTLGYA